MKKRDEKYVDTLKKNLKKIRDWLDDNDDKPGKNGKSLKSNITDNDSAKMKTSKGVIQGYNGIATSDSKHQIIVHAEAYGQGPGQDLLHPVIEGTEENFSEIGAPDIWDNVRLTADSGIHKETNMAMLAVKQIDAYLADNQMRKRDPRFSDAGCYKERHRKERAAFEGRSGLFKVDDFTFAEDLSHCICPAGKRIPFGARNVGLVLTFPRGEKDFPSQGRSLSLDKGLLMGDPVARRRRGPGRQRRHAHRHRHHPSAQPGSGFLADRIILPTHQGKRKI